MNGMSQPREITFLLLFLFLPVAASAGPEKGLPLPGGWETRAPLPTPRQEVGVAELDGQIYVIGGFNSAGLSVNTVERYHPATDQWTAAAPLPATSPLNHIGAASVGGFLYAVGGLRQNFIGVNWVFRYDPDQDAWDEVAPMPTARGAMGVAVVDGKIYAAGGSPLVRGTDFAVYDPALDEWTVLNPMPTNRNHLAAVGYAGKVYAFSGRTTVLVGATEIYDPTAEEWSAGEQIPTPRGGIAAAEVRGLIYVFGGEGNDEPGTQGVFDDVEAYNPEQDNWREFTPMPFPRHGIGAAALGGRIHIPGGGPIEGFGVTEINDAFIPPTSSLMRFR